MKRKVFVVLVVGVLLAAMASMSYARGPGRGMNCCPRWDCPRSYGYQWDYQWNAPQMGPGRGRMGPQMGPGQIPQNPQMRQDMYARNWELRNQIGEKLQERAWLLRQDPVDQGRLAQLNEELAQLQEEMWRFGPGPQGQPGPGARNCPTW